MTETRELSVEVRKKLVAYYPYVIDYKIICIWIDNLFFLNVLY